MENKKNFVFWGVMAVLIIGGLIAVVYFTKPAGNVEQTVEPTNSPGTIQSSSPAPISTPTPTIIPTKSNNPATTIKEPFIGPNGIKTPATCQVSGKAEFFDPGSYSSNTKISWQNVDSQGRLINWRISPNDNLAIGPNLFANLIVPDGQYDNLTIRLPENPVSKTYLLTASVTYGQFVAGDLKVKEVNCSGQAEVRINF